MTFIHPRDWRPRGIEDLEPRAWQALRETRRSLLVTAGAGAGKTEFLAQKAAYLLQTGICPPPKRILAISFKRDAAKNLALRVEKRCTADQARRLHSFTFDAFAKSLIDRFRAAIPAQFRPPPHYQIVTPRGSDLEDFLEHRGFHGFTTAQLQKIIARTQLPLDADDTRTRVAREYWRTQFEDYDYALISFSMINRLALQLIQENESIRNAIALTYPYVFLDEFQDTTFSQYEFLQSAFTERPPAFTAVGDDKQRIMVWAGAMPEAFQTFENDYNAMRISLLCNWRSHEDLVTVQHAIAAKIDPSVEHPEARAKRTVDGDVAAIWEFDNEIEEADLLAHWIGQEVVQETIKPHDAAILVRMHANDVEKKLTDKFLEHGLRLRNVAREVDGISIQDVLSEELTRIILPLLRLGSTARSPENWDISIYNLQTLDAVDPDDETALQQLQFRLQQFVRTTRRSMRSKRPDANAVHSAVQVALEFVDEEKIKQAFPEYRREQDFNRVWRGLIALLLESTAAGEDWPSILDEFEGISQVSLMTIHKSKGLEFHTVIFYGLDNKTWWSLKPGKPEELNSFFVAFTRARQRAFFTFCKERGQPVEWIERLLRPAGLNRVSGKSLIE